MLESYESLILLQELGSMGKVALRLNITQSTVSKRIQKLETHFGEALILPKGRNVVLTKNAIQICLQSKSHIYALKNLGNSIQKKNLRSLRLGVSESIISSWGAKVFYKILKKQKKINIEFHSHRSPFIFHHLETGNYQWGISISPSENKANLVFTKIASEPLWILPSKLEKTKIEHIKEILCIDSFSSTHKALKQEVAKNQWVKKMELESFNAIAQMAIAGFGHGLIPISTALSFKISEDRLIAPKYALERPIYFICNKQELESPECIEFIQLLKSELQKLKFLKPYKKSF